MSDNVFRSIVDAIEAGKISSEGTFWIYLPGCIVIGNIISSEEYGKRMARHIEEEPESSGDAWSSYKNIEEILEQHPISDEDNQEFCEKFFFMADVTIFSAGIKLVAPLTILSMDLVGAWGMAPFHYQIPPELAQTGG